MIHRLSVVACAAALFILQGCAREPEAIYSYSEQINELPELHQTSIRDGLTRLFGTPSNPRFMALSEEEPESDESDDEAEDAIQLVDAIDPAHLQHGAQVYVNRCAGCHGVTGDGQGEAEPYLRPKPRDYRNGVFKFTSTPYARKADSTGSRAYDPARRQRHVDACIPLDAGRRLEGRRRLRDQPKQTGRSRAIRHGPIR